ncbi:MAG: 50S ribosomal protein L23 [Candidatus Buchananbacteria bacterium]
MGIFNKPKTKDEAEVVAKKPVKKVEAKPIKETVKEEKSLTKPATKTTEMKGLTNQAYQVLIKPLVTEKATFLASLNKYVFAINPKMNKVEVKKAIRTIYKVNPVAVNISNFSGRYVRYGRTSGRTKGWKKAIVTLKAGDKIEVYEGV